jgi:hypothetical protein
MIIIMQFLRVTLGAEIVSIFILTEGDAGGTLPLYCEYLFIYLFAHVILHVFYF